MASLISADLDRSRASVDLSIDVGQRDAEGNVIPYTRTYTTDRRQDGETAQQYRQRLRDWLKDVRREARLMADLQKPSTPTRDDVRADIAPAFT